MGIKGIYGEIGPGERIAFTKLAVEHYERTGQPLRLAIDISIWHYQIRSGQGGSNPHLRTLYYRLLRLMTLTIQPLFVFDGPHKPPFKRGKKTGPGGATVPDLLTKQMLKLFGFPYHDAPGEAEAECALLQREGVVDAVLSEDVDTLMFGCGKTLRHWSAEGRKGSQTPTHVSVHDLKAIKQSRSGLDREGMILVALMSGGDYIPEGIPGCGIKVACEAARAGFGTSLCKISKTDPVGFVSWRDNLQHQLRSNENKFFRVKHRALTIPDEFPNLEVLSYYTDPVVSSKPNIIHLKETIIWDSPPDVQSLRNFTAKTFQWINRAGAIKFIRGLAPALLMFELRARGHRRLSDHDDILLTAVSEMEVVRAIHSKRTHFCSDGMPELRLVFQPLDIVRIELNSEANDFAECAPDGLIAVDEDIEFTSSVSVEAMTNYQSFPKEPTPMYNPLQADRVWAPETIAKVGIPLTVQDYEEAHRDPKKFITQKSRAQKVVSKGGMQYGALDRFVQSTRPKLPAKAMENVLSLSTGMGDPIIPKATTSISSLRSQSADPAKAQALGGSTRAANSKPMKYRSLQPLASNPWALASYSPDTSGLRVTKATLIPADKAQRQSKQEFSRQESSRLPDRGSSASPIPHPSSLAPRSRRLQHRTHAPSPHSKRYLARRSCDHVDRVLSPAFSAEDKFWEATSSNSKLDMRIIKDPAVTLASLEELPELRQVLTLGGPHKDSEATVAVLKRVSQETPRQPSKALDKRRAKDTRFLMLRQSLDGAWREVNEEEKKVLEKRLLGTKATQSWRMSEVEVIDLTEK